MKILIVISMLLLTHIVILSLAQTKAEAGIYVLKPELIKDSDYKPALVLPCWNGVVNAIWPQIFAYYVGQQGSFTVERNITKHGPAMLMSFDNGVLNHQIFGELEKITIEYENKRGCKSTFGGFGNFAR